ncbi:methyl-accepting chemotaxis protein [Cohnella kolymensis]|nr:methyl-accepting chemotaxis protein [Cohnella kolymensis]
MKRLLRDRVGNMNWKEWTRIENPIRSVGMKLFLLIFCSILAVVLCLGWFSYSRSSSIIKQKVADASEQTAQQTAGKINLLLDGYERQSMQLFTDNNFNTALNTMRVAGNENLIAGLAAQLNERLNAMAMADRSIESITMVPDNPSRPFITTGSSIQKDKFVKATFLKSISEGIGKPVWIPTMTKGIDEARSQPTFALGRFLNQGEPYYLIVEIRAAALEEQMKSVNFGEGSSTFIVSPDKKIVYSQQPAKLGTSYEYEMPDKDKSSTVTIDGTDHLSTAGMIDKNQWQLVGNIPVSSLVKDAKAISTLTWIMTVVAALIAGAIGLVVVLSVGRPLGQLRTLMNEGEKGNLTVRSTIRKKDEIGQVSDSFNRMMEEITGLVRQTNLSAQEVLATAEALTESSHKTAGAAKEIAVATEEIATGATNLATESERGTDLTVRIGTQVQSVIDSNNEMGQSANEVEQASRKGSDYMGTLIHKTGQTEEMTRSMVEKVDKLKESTRSIRKILDVLGNMTKQTNILSLNATIEAARAGAAGKGFMVVADEIRKLADQSRQSIGVVGEIVENIQREIDETVAVLSKAYPIFREQIESVREANHIFLTVQNNMTGFVSRLQSATDSVKQLESAQSTLSLAMTNVSAVAQQSSATSEEVASLSNEQLNISDGLVQLSNRLEAVSGQLRESLSRFTVS